RIRDYPGASGPKAGRACDFRKPRAAVQAILGRGPVYAGRADRGATGQIEQSVMDSIKQGPAIRIGDRIIGDREPCFVIAEVGNNHNGDFDRAIALIDAAVAAGADCAKFQMRKLDEVYRTSSLSGKDDDLAVEYTLDLLRRFELTTDQQRRLAAY